MIDALNIRELQQASRARLPAGVHAGNGMLWYRGDEALARAAAAAGIPFTISTASSIDVEEIARAGGRLWFQLYMWEDRKLSHAAMDRAWASGCDTLFITADMAVPPNREFMRRMGFGLPFKVGRRSLLDIVSHPRWALGVMGRYVLNGGLPRQANLPLELKGTLTRDPQRRASFVNDTLDWDEVKGLRDRWKGKFIVKGVMRGEDAQTALAIGADGVVVSNHGGRSLDCSAPTVSVLPEAFHIFFLLQRACEVQVATLGMGKPVMIPQSVTDAHDRDTPKMRVGGIRRGQLEFDAMIRQIDRTDRSWRD